MIKGSGIMVVWKETLYILGLAIIFLAISVKKFKVRIE